MTVFISVSLVTELPSTTRKHPRNTNNNDVCRPKQNLAAFVVWNPRFCWSWLGTKRRPCCFCGGGQETRTESINRRLKQTNQIDSTISFVDCGRPKLEPDHLPRNVMVLIMKRSIFRCPSGAGVAVLLVFLWGTSQVQGHRRIFGVERHQHPRHRHRHHVFEEYLVDLRGGRLFGKDNNNIKGHDEPQDTNDPIAPDHDASEDPGEVLVPEEEAPVVGVKSHHSNKKSNAVGDPDGEGSSDDEDDDEELSDWDLLDGGEFTVDEGQQPSEMGVMEHMHLAVEYVSDEQQQQQQQQDDEDGEETEEGRSRTGGGVGIRLGQRFKNHRLNSSNNNNNNNHPKSSTPAKPETLERHLLAAWQPHVYMPLSPEGGTTYLNDHARTMDGDGKTRLDRRTLYAGLLLEWHSSGGSGIKNHSSSSIKAYRKFLEKTTSQALLAALSLATQPAWRKSLPRPSGIRLYNNEEDSIKGCTLAMQESIAMALVCVQSIAVFIAWCGCGCRELEPCMNADTVFFAILPRHNRRTVWVLGWSY